MGYFDDLLGEDIPKVEEEPDNDFDPEASWWLIAGQENAYSNYIKEELDRIIRDKIYSPIIYLFQ